MKTIREIADEIGVSKQAVFKKIKREPLSTSLQGLTSTVDGRLTVSDDGEKLIKQAFSKDIPSTKYQPVDSAVDDSVDGIIAVLQATIDLLQGQLEVKDRQIEQMGQTITQLTDALAVAQQTAAAAQVLHAGTMKQQFLPDEIGDNQVSKEPEPRKRSWFFRLFT